MQDAHRLQALPRITHVARHDLANGRFDFRFPQAGQPRSAAVFKLRRGAGSPGAEALWLEPL